jgi:diguanylate cyclase (GGDEF)-like protein
MSPREQKTRANLTRRALSPGFENWDVEREFLAHDSVATIPLARFCYLNAVLIWAGFGLLDASVSTDKSSTLWTIRFAIGEPVLVFALIATYVRPLWPRLKLLGFGVTLVLGTCVLLMLLILGSPLSLTYYVGIILVLFPAYVFAQVRFSHALALSFVFFVAYIVLALTVDKNSPILARANLTFMFTTVYIGLVACFLLERARRREFVHLREIADKNTELIRLSSRDDLTGLLNRRQLEAVLEDAIALFRRESRTSVVMMVDLDDFKSVNDGFGHVAGDRILVEAAASIKETIGSTDSAFRIGGDEFLVFMPSITAEEAYEIARTIQSKFTSRHRLMFPEIESIVGMSIGVSQICDSTPRSSDLLKSVDDALYEAKSGGKNRVHLAEYPTPRQEMSVVNSPRLR